MIFANQLTNNTVASISQSSVRSNGMNQTSGQGFNNFGVSLTQGQPRNSVVGTRHIPIAKFSRGGRRAVGAHDASKRVTSINFYQNGHGQSHKLKNALDISLNKIEGVNKKSSGNSLNNSALNDSVKSHGTNIFIGSKKGA